MTVTTFERPMAYRPEPPRDGWGRYLIQTDPTRKAEGYTRATTLVKAIEDTTALEKWKMRQVAKGLVQTPSLMSMVGAHLEETDSNKKVLNGVCNDAMTAAGSTEWRDKGIALHAFAQQFDAGVMPQYMSAEDSADIGAYAKWRLDNGVGVVSSELVVCNDDIKVAGTFDRIYDFDGELVIGDLKTGSSVKYGLNAYAAQMAFYRNSSIYSYPEGCTCSQYAKKHEPCAVTHGRTPIEGVSTKRALIVWLPAGEARCEHVWVDIEAGWQAIDLAVRVRDYRKATVQL